MGSKHFSRPDTVSNLKLSNQGSCRLLILDSKAELITIEVVVGMGPSKKIERISEGPLPAIKNLKDAIEQ